MDPPPSETSKTGLNSSLFEAIRNGDINTVECLIQKFGVNFRRKWYKGYIMLYEAAKSKQFGVARSLLEMGAAVNIEESKKANLSNKLENSPLHYAVEYADFDVIKLMLSKGIDVNYKGKDEDTALHLAVRCNRPEAVKALLDYNSNINCTNYFRATPVLISIQAETDSLPMLELLARYQPDLSICSLDGMNPLLLAVVKSRTDTVKYLLELGADRSSVDAYNRTPLLIASENGCEDLCILLAEKGCNINKADLVGRTPLHYACMYGNLNIVKLLLAKGGDFNVKDDKGSTPLHLAASKPQSTPSVAEILLEYGADVNARDCNEVSPLHRAIQMTCLYRKGYNRNLVRLLLENRAEVNMLDKWGCSPLYLAAISDDTDVFSLLVCHGADINQKCEDCTPLFVVKPAENPPFPLYSPIHENAIKWKVLGLVVISKENISYLDSLSVTQTYENQCRSELNDIRNFNANLYYFLTKPSNELSCFINNTSLMEFICSKECVNRFPLYESIIALRLRRAEIRHKLLQECQEFYQWLNCFVPNCVELIVSYLSNCDLKSLSNW